MASFNESLATQMHNKMAAWARPVSVLFIIGAFVLLILCVTTQEKNATIFGPSLGADYPAFYLAGKILNSDPDRLYDLHLQAELYRKLAPRSSSDWFPLYPSAPFFAVPFRFLALLPYKWSYLAWLAFGLFFFVLGIYLLRNSMLNIPPNQWKTIVLLSASFMPLLFEGWLGGETTAFVFLCAALAIYLQSHGYEFASGGALAILSFKPTLLLLAAPMLLVCRRFRALMGFLAGGLALILVSLWAVGWQGCTNYARFLKAYSEVNRTSPEALIPWKYVDVRSALYPIFYRPSPISLAILLLFAGITGILLLCAWRRGRFNADQRQSFALALIWTPVLSPHCAIYDASLAIPAAILMVSDKRGPSPILISLIALVYITAWFSQMVSSSIGFQPLTLVIALLGFHQIRAVMFDKDAEKHKTLLPDHG